MLPVVLSPRAEADIDHVLDYLKQHAARGVAGNVGRRFDEVLAQIEAFPRCGALRPKFGKDVRILAEAPYVFLYEVQTSRAFVLRVLDGRRRITRKLVRGG